MIMFKDRTEAGRLLAEKLAYLNVIHPATKTVIIGLARGGVPVAAEISRYFHLPQDCMVVRKISHPQNEEFAIGAIGPRGFHIWDPIAAYLPYDYLTRTVKREHAELERRENVYRAGRLSLEKIVENAHVILVDDGIATGSTARLAVNILQHMNVKEITVAAPVAAADAVASLRLSADRVIVLAQPSDFSAVGLFFAHFPQISDEEVIQTLRT